MDFLIQARTSLEGIHPILPWALLTLGIFLFVYGSRKLFPSAWVWFDAVTPDGALGHAIMGLPSVALGALFTAFAAGGHYGLVWWGIVSGAAAPVLHLVMKWSPLIPYQGAVKAIATRAGISLLVAPFLLLGCSSFLRASDPTVDGAFTQACKLIGDQRKAAVEEEAKRAGLSLADAETAFQLACMARLLGAGAERAGLVGVQRAGIASDAGAP
jgi:hypothetical protein